MGYHLYRADKRRFFRQDGLIPGHGLDVAGNDLKIDVIPSAFLSQRAHEIEQAVQAEVLHAFELRDGFRLDHAPEVNNFSREIAGTSQFGHEQNVIFGLVRIERVNAVCDFLESFAKEHSRDVLALRRETLGKSLAESAVVDEEQPMLQCSGKVVVPGRCG